MQSNNYYGLMRLGVASTRTKLANVPFNVLRHIEIFEQAENCKVDFLLLPELGLSGYSCGVLFQQDELQLAILLGLSKLRSATESIYKGLAVVGAVLTIDNCLMNCAVLIANGRYLGVVPKTYLPNYKEFVETRWFASSVELKSQNVTLEDQSVPIGTDLLFEANGFNNFVVGVEICEDAWVPISPGDIMAARGAMVIGNISASNELVGKAEYRRNLILGKSGAAICGYGYSSAGPTESTTDLVFGGHCLIAENGVLLKESDRFIRESHLTFADIDLDRLSHDRQIFNSYQENLSHAGPHSGLYSGLFYKEYRRVFFEPRAPFRSALTCARNSDEIARVIDAAPFVPKDSHQLGARCEEIFNIQVNGLASRCESIGLKEAVIGISGGLDSTHALTVLCKCFDQLSLPRKNIHAYTMPGFGTSERTKSNAYQLMESMGVTAHNADIRELCLLEMQTTGYRPFGMDLTDGSIELFRQRLQELPAGSTDLGFENVQARMRTLILMNAGFVVGTGDLSELALGWCTYNADQMSMYNVNASIPKTLIKFLVQWTANNLFDGVAKLVMLDIAETEISPELLPLTAGGKLAQRTEDAVGPYELTDFFLYYFGRFGMSPEKIFYFAKHAEFVGNYSDMDLLRWLESFIRRFFSQQYKRSAMPDGPKVGTISLSPRAEWLMPSDADPSVWLEWISFARRYLS